MAKKHKVRVRQSSTYFIKESNLLKWLGIILLPFLICIIVALSDRRFAIWLPSFSMYQCGDWHQASKYHQSIDLAVMTFVNYEFVFLTLFFLCTFWLRNIKDEFSINMEIRAMTTILFVSDLLYISSIILLYNTAFVVLGFIQYIEVILCLSLLYLTALRPIR